MILHFSFTLLHLKLILVLSKINVKILITGGLGFIGSHLAEDLIKKNHKVILITKSFSKKNNILDFKDQIKVIKVNIINHLKLGKIIEKEKPQVIIHLAGETSHLKSFENPLYDIDVNAKSTLFILEKIRSMKLKCRFVLGSTFIVVGKPKRLPVNEETPCFPTTLYGINRLSSEYFCKVYNIMYDLDCVVFRITNSFGPREDFITKKNAVNFLIHQAFMGRDITIFHKGQFYRDLIYISDVISGIETITSKGKSGELYWISSSKKIWFYQLGNLLTKLTSSKIKYVPTPSYTKKVDVGNFVVDNSKLCSLGWKPKVDVKYGIKLTLKYFASLNS